MSDDVTRRMEPVAPAVTGNPGPGASPGGDSGSGGPSKRTVTILVAAVVVLALAVLGLGVVVFARMRSTPSAETSATVDATTTVEASTPPATASTEPTGPASTQTPATSSEPADATAPDTPEQLEPADGLHTHEAYVTLKWSPVTDESGVLYSVEVSERVGGGVPNDVHVFKDLAVTHLKVATSGMTKRWRVWAVDKKGNAGEKSGWWYFWRVAEGEPETTAVVDP
jgi:hypothetical protein